MKKVFLVGDYENEVQRTEMMREQQELERAGYKVINVMDIMIDPDTGEKKYPGEQEMRELVAAMFKKTDVIANYFTEESEMSLMVIEYARKNERKVVFSSNLYWNHQTHTQRLLWWKKLMQYLDNVSSWVVSRNAQKENAG